MGSIILTDAQKIIAISKGMDPNNITQAQFETIKTAEALSNGLSNIQNTASSKDTNNLSNILSGPPKTDDTMGLSLSKTKPSAAQKEPPTKTGGTQSYTEVRDGKTVTITTNSSEFFRQEQKNLEFAEKLRADYSTVPKDEALDIENSLSTSGQRSARNLQCEYLSTVEYTPDLTTMVGTADGYTNGQNSYDKEQKYSDTTSIVRFENKDAAVNYYLEQHGIPAKEKTSADVYKAETAVAALQPKVIEQAKIAQEYRAKFTDGTFTPEERDTAVNNLTKGVKFEGEKNERNFNDKLSGDKAPILNESERDALISKINSGSKDYTDRELNALTYLQGSTDHQGFPTIPKGMAWELPTSFESIENMKPDGNLTTRFVAPASGNNSSTLLGTSVGTDFYANKEKSPEYGLLMSLSEEHTVNIFAPDANGIAGSGEKVMTTTTQILPENRLLVEAAMLDGNERDLFPDEALQAGLITQAEYDKLDKNVSLKIEPENFGVRGAIMLNGATDQRSEMDKYAKENNLLIPVGTNMAGTVRESSKEFDSKEIGAVQGFMGEYNNATRDNIIQLYSSYKNGTGPRIVNTPWGDVDVVGLYDTVLNSNSGYNLSRDKTKPISDFS